MYSCSLDLHVKLQGKVPGVVENLLEVMIRREANVKYVLEACRPLRMTELSGNLQGEDKAIVHAGAG